MKTEKEVKKMRDDIQEKIDHCNHMALSQKLYANAEVWYDKKRQHMAQYNILLEVLK